jgi:excisionase family DNA binding protein
MSVEDVMEALNIGRSKVYELLRSEQIKSIKMKGYRIPKAAVKDFVLSQSKNEYRAIQGVSGILRYPLGMSCGLVVSAFSCLTTGNIKETKGMLFQINKK